MWKSRAAYGEKKRLNASVGAPKGLFPPALGPGYCFRRKNMPEGETLKARSWNGQKTRDSAECFNGTECSWQIDGVGTDPATAPPHTSRTDHGVSQHYKQKKNTNWKHLCCPSARCSAALCVFCVQLSSTFPPPVRCKKSVIPLSFKWWGGGELQELCNACHISTCAPSHLCMQIF